MSDSIVKRIETTERMKKHIDVNKKKQSNRRHYNHSKAQDEGKIKIDNVDSRLCDRRKQKTIEKVQTFFKSDFASRFNVEITFSRKIFYFNQPPAPEVSLGHNCLDFVHSANYEFVELCENVLEIEIYDVKDDFRDDMHHTILKRGDKQRVSKLNLNQVNLEGKYKHSMFLVLHEQTKTLRLFNQQQWSTMAGSYLKKPKKVLKRVAKQTIDDI